MIGLPMQEHRSRVAILLAAYNGERHIAAQIRSILDQSYTGWKLHIRDDGSRDATRAIALRFAEEHPDRICLFPRDEARPGADRNFSTLLEGVDSDYYMFCDQDDVWLPGKVEQSLRAMQSLEKRYGADSPLLVHTDLRVVDENLGELDSSVWHYGYHNPECSRRLNRLLIQNMVFGCATTINSRLKDLAAPVPDGVVQYDWWLALVAVCFGHIEYLREPTLLYRQHGDNSVGAARWGLDYILRKCRRLFDPEGPGGALAASRRQAEILLERYRDRLHGDRLRMISAYARLGDRNFFERRATLLRYGFLKTGLARNIGLFLRI